ncbi:SAM-dependent methyltransferase [Streptacidiphilus sp. PB12-B1b]|nr:SAM-dependent methyltransferase [Streptacidiphilus sp. PB12-B1b]
MRPEIPHPARIYDWLLGGKDHFPSDRAAGERLVAADPAMRRAARANRAFLQRAVRYLASEGVDQFLDIGTGIPSAGNTHEIAQSVDPRARVMYVDNDPVVLAHARALMAGPGHGETRVLQADLREPGAILAAPDVRALLDFGRPVALLLVGILHFVPDSDEPYAIVAELLDALAPGSHLVLTHGTGDFIDQDAGERAVAAYAKSSAPVTGRSRAEVSRFLDGLEPLPPGIVTAPLWHPQAPTTPEDARLPIYGVVARKP